VDVTDHGTEKKEKKEKHDSALKKDLTFVMKIHLVR